MRNFPHARSLRSPPSLSGYLLIWDITDHTPNATLRPATRDVFARRLALLHPNVTLSSARCAARPAAVLISGRAWRLHLASSAGRRCVFVNDARAARRGEIGILVDVR